MSRQFILSSLFGEDKPKEEALDARLAAVALMVHMMAVDGEVTEQENQSLRRMVKAHYATTDEETERLILRAREEDARAVDLYGFTRLLKNELALEERIHIVEMLWAMVYSDGDIHEFEDNLVWRVSELLAVDPQDRIAMKQKVRGEMLITRQAQITDEE